MPCLRTVTVEGQVPYQASSFWICNEQKGTVTGFFSSTSVSPVIICLPTLRNSLKVSQNQTLLPSCLSLHNISVISSHSFSPVDTNSPNFSAWDKFAFPFTVRKTRFRGNFLLVFFIISRQILGEDSYSYASLLTLTYTHTPYIYTYVHGYICMNVRKTYIYV